MSSLEIHSHIIGPLQTNCYVIIDKATTDAIMIDPGYLTAIDLATKLAKSGVVLKYIIITHTHPDHLGWAEEVAKVSEAEIILHENSEAVIDTYMELARNWGLPVGDKPSNWKSVKGKTSLHFGSATFKILHTPGHSPDSISIYSKKENIVFTGDTLFQSSVGRADLPFGDWSQLVTSISDVLYNLPDDTVVYPGHGPRTTIGVEKRENMFVRAKGT